MNKNIYLSLLTLFISGNLLAQSAPENDECAGAIELQASEICEEEEYSTEFATESLSAGFWCAGNPDDDVWFRFTATKPRMEIQATGQGTFDATIQYLSGTCSNLSPEPCADAAGPGETEVLLLEGLTVGQDYFFRVFDRGSVSSQTDFLFDICVIELDPLPENGNDFPCIALLEENLLDLNTLYYFDNTGATVDDNEFTITPMDGVCDDYDYSGWCSTDGIQNSSWFAFEAPSSGAVFIDVCNDGQTEILTQLAIYSFDDCQLYSSFSFIAGNEVSPDCASGSQISTCALTAGEEYLVLVDGYQIATGTFSLSINELVSPNAGTGNSVDACKNTSDFDLFAQLDGADSNGVWIDDDNTGNLINGTFNAANTPAGTYDFTYVIEGFTCFENDSATVSVTTLELPDAGENGTLVACTGSGDLDLFSALEGSPETGGQWYDPDGNSNDGMFDPDVDTEGVYMYVLAATDMDCPQDSSFATVTTIVTSGVDAGEDGDADVCTNTEPFEMIDFIGGTPDLTGYWTDSDSNPVDDVFDPSTQEAGNYLYIVGAEGCGSDFSILTITIAEGPSAGISVDTSVCHDGSAVDLNDFIGGTPDAGGVWKAPDGSVHGSTFDPATDAEGEYYYVVSSAGCPDDSAYVNMSIDPAANSGGTALSWICYDANEFFLFPLLTGDPQEGGVWTDPNGDEHDGFFDPAQDIEGDYVYTINGACDTSSTILTVNVDQEPNAGESPMETYVYDLLVDVSCDLDTLLEGEADDFGIWVDLDASGALDGSVVTFSEDIIHDTLTYQYIVSNVCGSDTSYVSIYINNSVGIDEGIESGDLSVYPNPSQGMIYIDSKHDLGAVNVKLIDLSGREVYNELMIIEQSINQLNFNVKKGNYILQFSNTNFTRNQHLTIK